MKRLTITFALVLSFLIAHAGDTEGKSDSDKATCTYTGAVLDAANAEALTGATVRLVELDRTVYADFDGNFTFENIPEGTYTVELSFVSYETKLIEGFVIDGKVKPKRFLL